MRRRAVPWRRPGGPWEPVEPRTDSARLDATTEADIEAQAAFDDAEAAKGAAAWVRRVRRRAGLSQAEFARRIALSVATVRGWEQGKLTPQGAARAIHLEGHLAELDINPLMVLPSGQGVKAADALVVLRGT